MFNYRESSNKLTDLTPLAVALELFSVSKKMLLTVSASDVINFSNNKKLLVSTLCIGLIQARKYKIYLESTMSISAP